MYSHPLHFGARTPPPPLHACLQLPVFSAFSVHAERRLTLLTQLSRLQDASECFALRLSISCLVRNSDFGCSTDGSFLAPPFRSCFLACGAVGAYLPADSSMSMYAVRSLSTLQHAKGHQVPRRAIVRPDVAWLAHNNLRYMVLRGKPFPPLCGGTISTSCPPFVREICY